MDYPVEDLAEDRFYMIPPVYLRYMYTYIYIYYIIHIHIHLIEYPTGYLQDFSIDYPIEYPIDKDSKYGTSVRAEDLRGEQSVEYLTENRFYKP